MSIAHQRISSAVSDGRSHISRWLPKSIEHHRMPSVVPDGSSVLSRALSELTNTFLRDDHDRRRQVT